MEPDLLELAAFHLTGKKPGGDLDGVGDLDLRPALFTAYRNLANLRHDYPLVLVEGAANDAFARSLSGIVDDLLGEIAPRGIDGERLRKHVLGLEREIRALIAGDAGGTLAKLWNRAAKTLLSGTKGEPRKALKQSLGLARAAVVVDGDVIDCDEDTPARLLTHAWAAVQQNTAQRFLGEVDDLVIRLSNILRADFMKSEEARSPAVLEGSFGTNDDSVIDFEAMSRILRQTTPSDPLPESRRKRILWAISTLESQRFFPRAGGAETKEAREAPHAYVFKSCAQAVQAYQERLAEMVEIVKAIAIARLEIENRYKDSKHDSYFDQFDENSLVAKDLALFPSYLVCLRAGRYDPMERANLVETLSAGLPVKVLVQTDDILEDVALGGNHFTSGIRSVQLATMAIGLNAVYVLQSSGSNLFQMRERICGGLTYAGPALFSVFSGSASSAPGVASYLTAAAAMQSRAFPAFAYDPAAGGDWASRFSVDDNPQAEADWPIQSLSYEDQYLQHVSEDVAFTFVDFVASDKRYAQHLARVPRDKWHAGMVPASEYLQAEPKGTPETVPYVLMVDENNVLQRVVVGETLIHAARRCVEMWHSIQELGGIHNSHARRLLERERETWQQEKERELETLRSQAQQAAAAPAPAPAAAPAATPAAAPAPGEAPAEAPAPVEDEEPEAPPSDEAYIETPRCTTCNECTDLNNVMFAYNENKQAYIADPDGGTYRQMVEAAETCQVSIIHPGKPRNPKEPGLDELIKRAETFL